MPPTPAGRLVELDLAQFDPWRVQAVEHRLAQHPLLQPDALVELGNRLEALGTVRTHSSDATAGTPFGQAAQLHPNRRSAGMTVQSIQDANAWLSLLDVQFDPNYRALVGEVLDDIWPRIEPLDPGMCYRAGAIFVSSPRTVTPFHFDKEHNLLLQVQGRKRVYVWEPDDIEVASEHARDRFHHRHERDLLQWRDAFRQRAHVFDMEPGQGAYLPSTSPHMVENGDQPSITMSFTYYTDATRRDALLHKAHSILRAAGIVPPPVGRFPVADESMHGIIQSMLKLRRVTRRLLRSAHTQGGCTRFALVEDLQASTAD